MIKIISSAALIVGMATSSYAGSLLSDSQNKIDEDAGVFVPVGGSSSASGIAVPLAIGGGVLAIGLLLSSDSTTDNAGEAD